MGGKVLTVCMSEKRGTEKVDVKEGYVEKGWGLKDDAHGGEWDRQISIFPIEAMARVPQDKKEMVAVAGYTENFTISGIPLENLMPGTHVRLGEAEIEILYVGKDEYKEYGRPYIVSREGRFGKVIKSGKVKVGDVVEILQ